MTNLEESHKQKILDEFQNFCATQIVGLLNTSSVSLTSIKKYSDRNHLERLLRARDYEIEKASEMWKKWVQWRQDFKVDNILDEDIAFELKSGKAFWHKFDKQGNPTLIVQIRNHIPAETTIEQTIRFAVYLIEIGINLAEKTGTEKITVIWDRQGFERKNFDKNFVTLIRQTITMFQDNYAERLNAVYVLYPNLLMRTAMAIFKPLIAQKVAQKIRIMNNNAHLQEYFDSDCLLQEHGGTSSFIYQWPIQWYQKCYQEKQDPQLQSKEQFQTSKESENWKILMKELYSKQNFPQSINSAQEPRNQFKFNSYSELDQSDRNSPRFQSFQDQNESEFFALEKGKCNDTVYFDLEFEYQNDHLKAKEKKTCCGPSEKCAII